MKDYFKIGGLLLLLSVLSYKVHANYFFRIYFNDKQNTSYSLSQPEDYLSSRSINRRNHFQIAIDSSDLPVNSTYIQALEAQTNGHVILKSKWLNTVVLSSPDSISILAASSLPFISEIKFVGIQNPSNYPSPQEKPMSQPGETVYYGDAWTQINLCKGEYLHQQNLLGQGMMIAVIDAGFTGYNAPGVLDSLIIQNRIADSWNYVDNSTNLNGIDHGTKVLSCMAGWRPDEYTGTAPLAHYALYVTDDAMTEQTIEEDYWIAAIERADSLGVDLVNSSLGYSYFDQSQNSYTYSDLDGKTTFITRGANAAVRKGMMVVVAMGNEGMNSWHYVLTPGDADSAFTIGSVMSNEQPVASSGWGPNAGGKIKPDVVGLGQDVMTINKDGLLTYSNGTSFATPVISGLIAGLMQAHPDKKPLEIMNAVRESASHFVNPNNKIGYGIPNFEWAHQLLTKIEIFNEDENIRVYPNPTTDVLHIHWKPGVQPKNLELWDAKGMAVLKELINRQQSFHTLHLQSLASGIYYLNLQFKDKKSTLKIIKK